MEAFDYHTTVKKLYDRAKTFDSPIQLQDDGHLRWNVALWDVAFYPLDCFDEASNFGVMQKSKDDSELVLSRIFIFSSNTLQRCIHIARPSDQIITSGDSVLMRSMPIIRQFPGYCMPNDTDKKDFFRTLEWLI